MPFSESPRSHVPASNVIPASHIRLSAETVPVCAPGHEPTDEPRINLIREGEAIRAIEVVCTCGKRIVLNCVY